MIENLKIGSSLRALRISTVLLLPLISMIICMYFAVNVPQWDDYHIILEFLVDFDNATGLYDKVAILFSPISNYLFVTIRLASIVDFFLFGQVNFAHLIFINGLAHLTIYYLIYRLYRRFDFELGYFMPVTLLLAVPNFEVQNWAAYSAHVFAILCILITIYLLSYDSSRRWYLALIPASLAVLSAGAGFLAFVCVLPILFYSYPRKVLKYWYLIFALIFLAYLQLILPFGEQVKGVMASKSSPLVYLLNVIIFFGSIFKDLYAELHMWGLIFGGLITLFFTHFMLNCRSTCKKQPVLTTGLLLSICLALVISIMRSKHGLGATTPYRYKLFQTLPVIFIYMYFLMNKEGSTRKFYPAILIGSIILYGFRMERNVKYLAMQHAQLTHGMRSFQLTASPQHLSCGDPDLTVSILTRSQRQGIYPYEQVEVSLQNVSAPRRSGKLQAMKYLIQAQKDTPNYYELTGWAFPSFAPMAELKVLLLLRVGKESHYFQTGPLIDKSVLVKRSEGGFLVILDKQALSLDWPNVKKGLALYHPLRGVIAEAMIDDP